MSYYIYYNIDNGAILAVTHELNPNFGNTYLETDFETYENFSQGNYIFHEYFVQVSLTKSELVKIKNDLEKTEYDTSIDYIPLINTKPKDCIIIEQNVKNGFWRITTTIEASKRKKYTSVLGKNLSKEIYIVEKNNPKILLDTIHIDFVQLLTKNKFDVTIYNNNVLKRKDITLLCSRSSENFAHNIIG